MSASVLMLRGGGQKCSFNLDTGDRRFECRCARLPVRFQPDEIYIVGTAGHIDHGKTALVKALTGIDADRLEEEKRRGITIDLGFAHMDLPSAGDGGTVKRCGWVCRCARARALCAQHAGGRGRDRSGSAGDCGG